VPARGDPRLEGFERVPRDAAVVGFHGANIPRPDSRGVRAHVARLTFENIRQLEGRWCVADLRGRPYIRSESLPYFLIAASLVLPKSGRYLARRSDGCTARGIANRAVNG
jgi:hypothetical protein